MLKIISDKNNIPVRWGSCSRRKLVKSASFAAFSFLICWQIFQDSFNIGITFSNFRQVTMPGGRSLGLISSLQGSYLISTGSYLRGTLRLSSPLPTNTHFSQLTLLSSVAPNFPSERHKMRPPWLPSNPFCFQQNVCLHMVFSMCVKTTVIL